MSFDQKKFESALKALQELASAKPTGDADKMKKIRRLDSVMKFADENTDDYMPMLDFTDSTGKKINEIDVMKLVFDSDKKTKGKNVTVVIFKSPPGLGKTTLARYFAKMFKCPFETIDCKSDMTSFDLLGNFTLIPGENGQSETVWVDSHLPAIIRATNAVGTGVLVVNEINVLNLQAQVALNPLMDRQQCVVLTMFNGEVVKVDKDAHLLIIASMNPDIVGVGEIQESVADRADIVITMDYPTAEKEAKLASKMCGVSEQYARQFADVISECRFLKTRDHKVTRVPSTRGLTDWINYTPALGVETAFELAVVNKYGDSVSDKDAFRIIAKGKNIKNIKVEEKKDLAKILAPKAFVPTITASKPISASPVSTPATISLTSSLIPTILKESKPLTFSEILHEKIEAPEKKVVSTSPIEKILGIPSSLSSKKPRAKSRPVKKEDEKIIIEMRKSGKKVIEIAKALDKTTAAVHRCLSRNGMVTH